MIVIGAAAIFKQHIIQSQPWNICEWAVGIAPLILALPVLDSAPITGS